MFSQFLQQCLTCGCLFKEATICGHQYILCVNPTSSAHLDHASKHPPCRRHTPAEVVSIIIQRTLISTQMTAAQPKFFVGVAFLVIGWSIITGPQQLKLSIDASNMDPDLLRLQHQTYNLA